MRAVRQYVHTSKRLHEDGISAPHPTQVPEGPLRGESTPASNNRVLLWETDPQLLRLSHPKHISAVVRRTGLLVRAAARGEGITKGLLTRAIVDAHLAFDICRGHGGFVDVRFAGGREKTKRVTIHSKPAYNRRYPSSSLLVFLLGWASKQGGLSAEHKNN